VGRYRTTGTDRG